MRLSMNDIFKNLLEAGILEESAKGIYHFANDPNMASVNHFSLWDMAGALMEKCPAMEIDTIGNPWWVVALRHEKPEKWFKVKGESLPRTIIEACVKARA